VAVETAGQIARGFIIDADRWCNHGPGSGRQEGPCEIRQPTGAGHWPGGFTAGKENQVRVEVELAHRRNGQRIGPVGGGQTKR